MQANFKPSERRAEPRIAVKVPARVFYGPGLAMWADCTIRDRSASGAKAEISSVFALPSRVILTDLQSGTAFEAVVKWRRGDMAGLQFEAQHDLNGDVDKRLAGVRETWQALKGGVAPG